MSMGNRPAPVNQKHNEGWFLLRRFVDLFRDCPLCIIGRNQSNTFSLINLQKTKTPPKYNIAARTIWTDIIMSL